MSSAPTIEIQVQYFAILREQRGQREEHVSTMARTAGELYDELKARHGFDLPKDILKVALNGRFDRPIREQIDTAEARAGLACTSCHAITRVDSSMALGQAAFTGAIQDIDPVALVAENDETQERINCLQRFNFIIIWDKE